MKKLTLDLDALHVESFDVSPSDREPRGTVKGHDSDDTMDLKCWRLPAMTQDWSCQVGTCGNSCQTCGYSCNGTCSDPTCFGDSCICYTDGC